MKNIYRILSVVIAVLSVHSCQLLGSLDNIKPENVLDDNTLITDERSAEQALRGVYYSWMSYEVGTYRNAQFVLSGTLARSNVFGATDFASNTVKEDNKLITDYYTGLYKVINMANSVISRMEEMKSVPGVSEKRYMEIIAEAKFNRALAHHMLLKTFGEYWDINSESGIVYMEKPARNNTPQKRESVASSYEKINEDLDFVIQYARETLDSTDPYGGPVIKPHVYATQLSGMLLKARNLLYMKKYKDVITLCGTIKEEGRKYGYYLEDKYSRIYEGAYSSPEHVFTLFTLSPNQKCQLYLYDFGIMQTGSTVKTIADRLKDGPQDGDMETGNGYDTRFAECFASAFRLNPTRINKYLYDDSTPNQPGNTEYFLRFAEVYYILAEACIMEKDFNGARQALADVCTRAGYDLEHFNGIPDNELMDHLFMHKYIEFCAECGEEFIDAVRLKVHAGCDIAERLGMNIRHYHMPVPKDARAGNNLLTQNSQYINNL